MKQRIIFIASECPTITYKGKNKYSEIKSIQIVV